MLLSARVGALVGVRVGRSVGELVGSLVGGSVGVWDGLGLGECVVGGFVGTAVGLGVGANVGVPVVGLAVGHQFVIGTSVGGFVTGAIGGEVLLSALLLLVVPKLQALVIFLKQNVVSIVAAYGTKSGSWPANRSVAVPPLCPITPATNAALHIEESSRNGPYP